MLILMYERVLVTQANFVSSSSFKLWPVNFIFVSYQGLTKFDLKRDHRNLRNLIRYKNLDTMVIVVTKNMLSTHDNMKA